jgi:hypothetical protein
MIMFRKVVTILASFFLFANVLHADTSKRELSKFKGITEIDILMNVDEDFENETGLSENRIRNQIALKFRQSSIKITDKAADFFILSVYFVDECGCTYLKAELFSPAYLERNRQFVYASTWMNSIRILGYAGNELGNCVTEEIEAFVNEFLNIYLEANPR